MSDANFRVKNGLDVKDGIITVDDGSIKIKERATAPADTAAYGQLWVKNSGDGLLYFTDDNGTDIQITTATAVNAGGDTNAGGVNGSASAPTFSFTSDTTWSSGRYHGAGNFVQEFCVVVIFLRIVGDTLMIASAHTKLAPPYQRSPQPLISIRGNHKHKRFLSTYIMSLSPCGPEDR